jgi:hypothetical protein
MSVETGRFRVAQREDDELQKAIAMVDVTAQEGQSHKEHKGWTNEDQNLYCNENTKGGELERLSRHVGEPACNIHLDWSFGD